MTTVAAGTCLHTSWWALTLICLLSASGGAAGCGRSGTDPVPPRAGVEVAWGRPSTHSEPMEVTRRAGELDGAEETGGIEAAAAADTRHAGAAGLDVVEVARLFEYLRAHPYSQDAVFPPKDAAVKAAGWDPEAFRATYAAVWRSYAWLQFLDNWRQYIRNQELALEKAVDKDERGRRARLLEHCRRLCADQLEVTPLESEIRRVLQPRREEWDAIHRSVLGGIHESLLRELR